MKPYVRQWLRNKLLAYKKEVLRLTQKVEMSPNSPKSSLYRIAKLENEIRIIEEILSVEDSETPIEHFDNN